ncbi:hypothetical protein [Methanomethylophilus alvi]|uniref:hypothetical protein n=1 Tax=Methanomethylophilus alvi TaxID=1291540 RepID=UPI0037DD0F33
MITKVIQMSTDFPEKVSLDYVIDNVTNMEWAKHVSENYRPIVNQFNENDLPEACTALAWSLIHLVEGQDSSDETYQINRTAADICRIGINSLSNCPDKEAVIRKHLLNFDVEADLLSYLATTMINVGRPIAAFGYYDHA